VRYPARLAARLLIPAGTAACLVAGQPAAGAVTAVPLVAKPTITSFTLSRSSLPSSGGDLTMKVTVTHASTCTFSSSPGLPGLPAKLGCKSGSASRKVALPANTSATARTYTFKVTVTGPGGTITSKPLTATVHGAKPAVTGFAAAPNGLTSSGGTTTLTASVVRSSTCVLSAVPAVAGLPVSFACSAGTTPKPVSRSVGLPALTSAAAVPYTFTLTATGAGGTAKATATQTVWPTMTFRAPAGIDIPSGGLDDVSCGAATLCVAVDRYGNAVTFNGTTWSALQGTEPLPDGLVTGMDTAVSCASATFCAELAQDGDAVFFDGSSWSKPVATGLGASSVSCASASFCGAIGGSYASVYTGSAWTSPTALVTSTPLESVACPTATFCLAVNFGGDSFTYNGSSWSSATAFDAGASETKAVSCNSATLCVAVDADGQAAIYNGSTWSTPAKVVTGLRPAGFQAVSCAHGTVFCMATTADGEIYTFNGSSWSGPNSIDSALGAVSCRAATACEVLGTSDIIHRLAGTTWTDSPQLDSVQGFTQAVSCPATSFCAAVDWTGSVVTYNGSTWSKPTPIDPGFVFSSISCSSKSFCMAFELSGSQGSRYMRFNGSAWLFGAVSYDVSSVSCASATFCIALASIDASVYALRWNGSSWSAPVLIDSAQGVDPPPGTGYVSCASSSFCAVADTGGNVLTFDGSSWSAPDTIDAGVLQPLAAISCPTATFCAAIDGFGQAFTYNGTSWSGPAGVENAGGMTGISCASAQFCVAVDEQGNLAADYEGTWSAPVNADPGVTLPYGFTGVSCPSVGFCAAVDFGGNVVTGTG